MGEKQHFHFEVSLRPVRVPSHFTVTHFPRLSGPSRYGMMRAADGEEVRPSGGTGLGVRLRAVGTVRRGEVELTVPPVTDEANT